jgi:putative hemolysin
MASGRTHHTVSFVFALALLLNASGWSIQPVAQAQMSKPPSVGMADPAAVYCSRIMGYEFRVEPDVNGRDEGFCIFPDGEKCEAWAFLSGQCGREHSYCARQGHGTDVRTDGANGFSPVYAVCVNEAARAAEGATAGPATDLAGAVTDLVGLAEELRNDGCDGGSAPQSLAESHLSEPDKNEPQPRVGTEAVGYPSSFDWRTYNGQDWMTGIRDQGGCGSCWAFAAIGATEGEHNIAANNPDLDLDLSEQSLLACQAEGGGGGCCGGSSDSAFDYIVSTGVVDEACLPYVDGANCSCSYPGGCSASCSYKTGGACSSRTCSDRCSDWTNWLTRIDSYDDLSGLTSSIKDWVATKGPVVTYMGFGSDFGGYFDGSGIYRCTNDGSINHAVVIVGYNEPGNYWIIRNSWGAGWGEGGYFKLGYGECNVGSSAYAPLVVAPPPTVKLKVNGSDVPIRVPANSAATLSWKTTNATACTASSGWSGSRATSGSESTGPLSATRTYVLQCTGAGGTASDQVTVNVGLNLLCNGGFEQDRACWGGWGTDEKVLAPGFASANALHFFDSVRSKRSISQTVTVRGNAAYSLTGQVKTSSIDSGQEAHMVAEWRTRSGTVVWRDTVNVVDAPQDWGLKATTLVAPANAGRVRVYLELTKSASNDGVAWFDEVTLTEGTPPLPTVDLKINGSDGPVTISLNGAATLSWTTTNATGCTASGGWSGLRATSGSESTGALTSTQTYALQCTGAGGTASDQVTVNLQPICLTTPITVGGSNQNGSLTVLDCDAPHRPGSKADLYTFSASAGQIVAVALSAQSSVGLSADSAVGLTPDFDAYLILVGPDGSVVADNNDCPGWGPNSCLMDLTLPSSGTYTIEVTSRAAGATGSYELSLSSGPVCTLAVAPSDLTFESIPGGVCTPEQYFTIQNQVGCPTITGSASASPNPPFVVTSGGALSIAPGEARDVGVSFCPPPAGTVSGQTTFITNRGNTSRTLGVDDSGGCPVTALTPGATVSGTLATSDCHAPHRAGAYGDLYTFNGVAGQGVVLQLNSSVFDTYLFLLDSGGTVLAENDDTSEVNRNSQVIMALPYTGTYQLEATSYYSGVTGDYQVGVFFGVGNLRP